jgi:TPR repeat protein
MEDISVSDLFSATRHWGRQHRKLVEGAGEQQLKYIDIIINKGEAEKYLELNPDDECVFGTVYLCTGNTEIALKFLINAASRGDEDAIYMLETNFGETFKGKFKPNKLKADVSTAKGESQKTAILTPSGEAFDEAYVNDLMQKAMAGDMQASKILEEKHGFSMSKVSAPKTPATEERSTEEKNTTTLKIKKNNPILSLFRYLVFGLVVAFLAVYFTSDPAVSPKVQEIKSNLKKTVNSTINPSTKKGTQEITSISWNNVYMLPGEKFSFEKLNIRHSYQQLITAARNGDIEAKIQVALMYMYGVGVKQNSDKAQYWFKESAKDNHPQGQKMYGYTLYGTQNSQAFKYIKKAAQQGDIEAQYLISKFYLDGIGVKKNKEKSMYWFDKALAKEMWGD